MNSVNEPKSPSSKKSSDPVVPAFAVTAPVGPGCQKTGKVLLTTSNQPKHASLSSKSCHIVNPIQCSFFPGVSGNSRSRPFPRMKASDSLSRIMGMVFFIPFPFPNCGNGFFSFPSRSRIMGMVFFPFPSHSQELNYCERYQTSIFFSFLNFSKQLY